MKNYKYKSLIVVSVILGIFISLQLKTINLENNGMTTSKKGEQLAIELKSLKNEEENLKEEINEIKNNIDKYKGNDNDVKNNSILSEIEKYEILAGYTEVKGKGIEVKINTTQDPIAGQVGSSILYNYDLILSLINKLNSAQANAISVNGKRVVANTYLHLKSDKLYINDVEITEPIIVKAIGDPDTLASALQIKYGIVWELEKYYNATVDIEKKDNIEISGKNQPINPEYSVINE